MPSPSTPPTELLKVTIGQLFTSLDSMSGVFLSYGKIFAGVAIILTVLYGVYSWWTSGSIADLASNGIRTLIILAPIVVLLSDWSGYMDAFTNFFFKDIPGSLGYSTTDGALGVVGTSIESLVKSVKFEDPPGWDKLWWNEKMAYFFSMSTILTLIMKGFALLLTALLAFGILVSVLMPVAGLYIGIIFGPLILPWLLWKPLSDMASRWLGFMIGNGITFAVAIVILKAMSGTLTSMTSTLQGMAGEGFASAVAAWAVTFLALLAIYIFALNLMLQANNMAQGMTGGATVGEGLLGALTAGAAAAGMMRAAGATANLHKMGAKEVAKAAANAPGATGSILEKGGKIAQAAGMAKAISGGRGGGALATAGNAMRTAGAALNAAQKGVNAVGNVASKGVNKVKSSGVYKELNKPILKPFSGSGGGNGG